MNAAELARALNGRRYGRGWRAQCPAHADRHPSLGIAESNDGCTLVHCWSGCSQREVIDALRDRGLWSSSVSSLWTRPTRPIEERFPASAFDRPAAPACCLTHGPRCEHWKTFARRWLLGELHKNLVEACRELVEKFDRAGKPVTAEILRAGVEFAIGFGAIAVPGVDDETFAQAIGLVVAEFTRNERAA